MPPVSPHAAGKDGAAQVMTDQKAVWMRAGAVAVLAGLAYLMVLAYGRYGHSLAMGDEAGDEAPVEPGGPTGAATRAKAKQLQGALQKKLGTNARGLPRVAHVDYEGWPDRLLVVFALDRNLLTMSPAEAAELRPMADVLREVHAAGLAWKWVLLCGTAPVEGPGGSVSETTVVRALFSQAKLGGVDWARLRPRDLEALAEQFTTESELATLRPGEAEPDGAKPPATLPAGPRPATPDAPGAGASAPPRGP